MKRTLIIVAVALLAACSGKEDLFDSWKPWVAVNSGVTELIETDYESDWYSRMAGDPSSLFYENEIYRYYFECYDNNEFYLIVNNEDKFQVKEFLDDSKYNYDIGMLLTVFDYSDIDYKAQNKYPHFNLSVNNEIGNSYFGPSDVESDIAKLVLTDKSTDGYNLNFEVNIIPKNSGERVMNIDFEFTDASGKITVMTKKVKIIVDDDMNVEYSLE